MLIIDPIIIVFGFVLAFNIRYGGAIAPKNWTPFLTVLPWMCIGTMILFAALGLYDRRFYSIAQLVSSVAVGIIGVLFLTMAATFWLRGFAFPRSVMAIALPLQVLLICSYRYLFWQIEMLSVGRRKLLIVVADAEDNFANREFTYLIKKSWFSVRKVVLYADFVRTPGIMFDTDAVMISPFLARDNKAAVVEICVGAAKEVLVIPDMYDILLSQGKMTSLSDLPVVQVQDLGFNTLQAFVKRVIDLLIAVLGTVLCAPVLVLCALLIKISSPGPVIYKQERVGRMGKNFNLYKFRTMVDGAEKLTGPILSTDQDPRITWCGRFLRAARLDEIPQLINVLKGDMSLVGPRPERPFFVNQFADTIPDYYRRHLVRPGITGLAQIYGKYSTLPEDKLKYDLYYISNYSLIFDLQIVLRTLPILLDFNSSKGIAGSDAGGSGQNLR